MEQHDHERGRRPKAVQCVQVIGYIARAPTLPYPAARRGRRVLHRLTSSPADAAGAPRQTGLVYCNPKLPLMQDAEAIFAAKAERAAGKRPMRAHQLGNSIEKLSAREQAYPPLSIRFPLKCFAFPGAEGPACPPAFAGNGTSRARRRQTPDARSSAQQMTLTNRRRGSRLTRRCPLRFPLKCFAFPGAEGPACPPAFAGSGTSRARRRQTPDARSVWETGDYFIQAVWGHLPPSRPRPRRRAGPPAPRRLRPAAGPGGCPTAAALCTD